MFSLRNSFDTETFNFDSFDWKNTSITVAHRERLIGEMTIRVMNGTTVRNDIEGIHITHPDGTKQFINWTWFD